MAKRWLIGGLAVGVGALMVAPEARTWLRRRLGLEPEDRRWFEEEGAEAPEYEGDEPLDTREARFSLRARLSEDAPPEPDAPAAAAPLEAPEPESPSAPAPTPFPSAVAPAPEPTPFRPAVAPVPAPLPRAAEPEPDVATVPEPEPDPEPVQALEPESTPFSLPTRDAGSSSFEAVPAITPEADAPRTPGEDTDEVGPLPAEEPLPPPTELRPPPPPPSRPFSSEGASFREAIDAARERVHGAAREATPDQGDTEPLDKDA